jgi:Uma2 family endonuclease
MEKTAEGRKRLRTRFSKSEIPGSFVYEQIDGKPVHFSGYKDVLNGLKTFEEIMGSSDIQAVIVGCLTRFFNITLDNDRYFSMAAETGLHLQKNTNLASDIVIYDKKALQARKLTGNYLDYPPLAVVEVDIEADVADLGMTQVDYYSLKTQKLLDFGVKEVFWIFTASKKIVVARQNQDWLLANWDRELTLLDTCTFSLSRLLAEDGWVL